MMIIGYSRPRRRHAFGLFVWGLVALLVVAPVSAQAQCGVVSGISYPVDTAVYRLAQDYGSPSVRHQGRYHTGEDWFAGRDNSVGQPVHAIAAGRVIYAAPQGWGRDGGVMILEHIFPDNSTAYSLYGHLAEPPAASFPAAFSCVAQGDVIGVTADVRPAPHVHLEIKLTNPSQPGAGYSFSDPDQEGRLDPGKFIYNWQAWLQPAHQWHVRLGDEGAPQPVALDDGSLIAINRQRAERITADGRSLWRIDLPNAPLSLLPGGDGALLLYGDGTIQAVSRDGDPGETRSLGVVPVRAPLPAGDVLLVETGDQTLVALDAATLAPRWTLPDMPPLRHAYSTGSLIGLLTERGEMLVLSADGQVIDWAQTREGAAFGTAPNGNLLAYTRGGLWSIGPDGAWSVLYGDVLGGGEAAALAYGENGAFYLFDGDVLRAYDGPSSLRWEVALPGVSGLTHMEVIGRVVLIASDEGHIRVVQATSGGLCNSARIYGTDQSRLWMQLGADGILRMALADQLLALDWQTFLGACR